MMKHNLVSPLGLVPNVQIACRANGEGRAMPETGIVCMARLRLL
jgi:hypothetical protein